MNIVTLSEVSLESVIGGAERVLREHALGLTGRGHTVRAVVRAPAPDAPSHISVDGISELRYQISNRNAASFVTSSVAKSVQSFDSQRADAPVDHVLIHQSLAGLGPILQRRDTAKRWTYVCLSLAHEEFQSRNPDMAQNTIGYFVHTRSRRWIEHMVMTRCQQVIVLSQFMKERVMTTHSIPEQAIHIIPGGADHHRFLPIGEKTQVRHRLGIPPHNTVLLTVRNLVPRMGLETLIRALSQLKSDLADCLLLIGGSGPLRASLEQLVATHELSHHVRFVGFIPEEDLVSYYQAADLVLMPTYELEGFGLVTVEALACGTPVLSTPVGALPEVLTHIDPTLIAEGREDFHLAKGLNALLHRFRHDPQSWNALSQRCRQGVEAHFTWVRHTDQLDDLLLHTPPLGRDA